MELISAERLSALLWADEPLILKLELRDRYAFDDDLLDAWRRGDQEAVDGFLAGWRDKMASEAAAGRRIQRVRVVSEPLSEYQQMLVDTSGSAVDVGEELRWLPRRLVSCLPLPGNDCFVLEGAVIFNVLDGNDEPAEIQLHRDPDVLKFCREAFEAVWEIATPHREFKPA